MVMSSIVLQNVKKNSNVIREYKLSCVGSFSDSLLMADEPLRNAECLCVSLYPVLSQFSMALEEDFLPHSGCTL